jgi:CO dehydrogenase/acetyl-CoA synthase alpha subunit
MTPAPASLPDQLADAEGELPEEIGLAIEMFRRAARDETRYPDGKNMSATASARTTLAAAILSRLTAAEAERDAALARAERLEKALEEIVSFTRTERCCLREQEIASIAEVAEASRAALADGKAPKTEGDA